LALGDFLGEDMEELLGMGHCTHLKEESKFDQMSGEYNPLSL